MIELEGTHCDPQALGSGWLHHSLGPLSSLEGAVCGSASPGKPGVHHVKGRLAGWGFPTRGLKPFPAKRKQSKGHVPSPDTQLNPPWEDSLGFRSRELPQQMFSARGWGAVFQTM